MGIPGRAPLFCWIPDCGIIFIAIGFDGMGPFTGVALGIPCIWGRAWLAPTPGGNPLGSPLGNAFGRPFAVLPVIAEVPGL